MKNIIIAVWTEKNSQQGVIEAYSSLAGFMEIHPEYNEYTITNYLTRKKVPYITDELTLMKVPFQRRQSAEDLAKIGRKKKPVKQVKSKTATKTTTKRKVKEKA
jgi:hypothetical protein